MRKRITSYTFDASEKTVTLTGLTVSQEGVLIIYNTTDNIELYNFAISTNSITVTGSVITLSYNTTSMDDTDDILIIYDDGATALTDTELRTSDVNTYDEGSYELLIRVLEQVSIPIWYSPTANALMVSQAGTWTISTLNTVTTVTGITNVGGDSAAGAGPTFGQENWGVCIRSRLV